SVLGLLYRLLEQRGGRGRFGRRTFLLFHLSCVPAFALSLLWNGPPFIVYALGAAAAAVQLAGLFFLAQDLRPLLNVKGRPGFLLRLAAAAFAAKLVLQAASAFPAVARLAYLQRNFVIAYLHLVLIGFVSLAVFALVLLHMPVRRSVLLSAGLALFIGAFTATELLLVAQAFGWMLPRYTEYLLLLSMLMAAGTAALAVCFLRVPSPFVAQTRARQTKEAELPF
ncbi:MAG TPA: hypothetical protein VHK69_16855, partial [Chitinophagaceae bacterium]|nr:hypothetical protein [Chitinophagaceae bacterium]